MLTDYHVHLRPDDARARSERDFTAANAERYRETATERGIAELGVAEHVYRFSAALDVWQHPFWRRVRVRRPRRLLRLRARGDRPAARASRRTSSPAARTGSPRCSTAREWDYVVGSVHFLREHSRRHRGLLGSGAPASRPSGSGGATSRRSPRRPAPGSSTSWPPRPGQDLGPRGADPGRRPAALLRAGRRGVRGRRRGRRGLHRRAAQAGRRASTRRARSWRCWSTPAARSPCPATRTCPTSSASSTSAPSSCCEDASACARSRSSSGGERRLEPIG